jgi:tRNA wybutosine-synthesizing protein 4
MTTTECYSMSIIYTSKMDAVDRARIEKLEIFDEFEEWDMLQSHYCLALGKRFADSEQDKRVHL